MKIRIDRCVCYDVTFERLLNEARLRGAGTVEELQTFVEFGRNCGMCRPYVETSIRTGVVVFDRLIEAAPRRTSNGGCGSDR